MKTLVLPMVDLLEALALPKLGRKLERIKALQESIGRKDPYYEGHIRRACSYSLEFGRYLELSEGEIQQLYLATFFHDIGKVMIPARVINKKGPHNPSERWIMQSHPALGEKICRGLGSFEKIAFLVGSHHEKPNGTGYPSGLEGDEIPVLGRILAIIDVYDALRSRRSYKLPFLSQRSLEILSENADLGNLDAQVVEEFVKFSAKTGNRQAPPARQYGLVRE